jgi:hypothetical protein
MSNDQTPAAYATDYASTLAARWSGALGDAVRRFTPAVWPGVPPEALVGFTTIGSQYADTGLPPVNNPFHEVGYFQTEAGPNYGPSPNPDPSAPYNRWGQLASDPRVVALLDRAATMDPNGWQAAVDDQTAVGLVNILDDAAAVARGLPGGVAPQDAGSLWHVALGFSGFSAGVGGTQASVSRYAAQLATAPESQRFAAWVAAILQDAAAGTLPGNPGQHGNPAYDALRVWQKLASGQALAQQTGGNAGWFDVGFGLGTPAEAQAQQDLDDAAYGRSAGVVPFAPRPQASPLLGAVAVAAVVGGAAYGWWWWTHGGSAVARRWLAGARSNPSGRRLRAARRARRNPATVPLDLYDTGGPEPYPYPFEDPSLGQDERSRRWLENRRHRERVWLTLGERTERAREAYLGVVSEALSGMSSRLDRLRSSGLLQQREGPAEWRRLGDELAALVRDGQAANFAHAVWHSRLFIQGNMLRLWRGGSPRSYDLVAARDYYEQRTALLVRWVKARAAFEARPEVMAGRALRSHGRVDYDAAAAAVQAEIGMAQGDIANGLNPDLHLAVTETRLANLLGILRSPDLTAAEDAPGVWTPATMLPKVRAAEKLAAKGEPPLSRKKALAEEARLAALGPTSEDPR